MQTPKFISISLAITIHQEQIDSIGGTPGIRDKGLLDSALAQPQATFGSDLLHPTIQEQAAAYLFHLAMNHAFVDGNKRTAFAVMVTFIDMNGYTLNLSQEEAYNLVIGVVQREITKEELSILLKVHLQPN